MNEDNRKNALVPQDVLALLGNPDGFISHYYMTNGDKTIEPEVFEKFLLKEFKNLEDFVTVFVLQRVEDDSFWRFNLQIKPIFAPKEETEFLLHAKFLSSPVRVYEHREIVYLSADEEF